MKGIFIKKPHGPRYEVTWDVSVVLNFLKTLFPLESLSIKMLTFKVTALIALANAPRAQTLVSLDLDNMFIEDNFVLFLFNNVLKTSRIGHNFSMKIEHFRREELCAMHTLLHYITRTKSVRKSQKVLVSFVTFKEVTTSTVARWLRCVLNLSGIDTDRFKAHSYRGASVSAAFNKGCSLKCILNTADWKSDKHFRKYYYRNYVPKKQLSFANAVLD
jgi:hypothetical protein